MMCLGYNVFGGTLNLVESSPIVDTSCVARADPGLWVVSLQATWS